MKKYTLATLLIVHTTIGASPIDKSLLNQLCFKIASNKAFRACYKIGQIGTVAGISYLLLQYLNAHRNPSHKTLIQYTPGGNYHRGTINIHTDGHVTIQCHQDDHAVENFSNSTCRQDPDAQRHTLFQQTQPQHLNISLKTIFALVKNFVRWIVQPANRAIINHIISVPPDTKIVLTKYTGQILITNINPIGHNNRHELKYAIQDHTDKCDIIIDGHVIQPKQLEKIN